MKPPKLDYHGLSTNMNSKNMIFYNNILKMMIQIQSNLKYIWRDDIVTTFYSDFVSAKLRFKIYNSGSRNKLRTDDLEQNPQLRVQPLGMLYISCFGAVGNQHSTTGRKPHRHPWGSTNLNGLCEQMTQWSIQIKKTSYSRWNQNFLKACLASLLACRDGNFMEFRHVAQWKYNEAHKVWTIPMLAFHSEQFALQ